jgi:hypothetical protein
MIDGERRESGSIWVSKLEGRVAIPLLSEGLRNRAMRFFITMNLTPNKSGDRHGGGSAGPKGRTAMDG